MINISEYILQEMTLFNISTQEQLLKSLKSYKGYTQFIQKSNLTDLDSNKLACFMIHKSFVNERSFELTNNETLEFLGDSVLQLIVSNELYNRYPEMKEGELSKLRSAIVNEKSLANLGRMIGLDKLIVVGKGENKNKGYEKDSLVSDAFEALLGAIYSQKGLERAVQFMSEIEESASKKKRKLYDSEILTDFDSKSRLQELVMGLHQELPKYVVKEQDDRFTVSLFIKGQEILSKEGISKKNIMQIIAKETIKNNLYQLRGK